MKQWIFYQLPGTGKSNIIIYTTEDGLSKIDTFFDGDTVWLSKAQMSELFQRDRYVISKHIKNIFEEGELPREGNVQILHIANSDKPVEFYNLDVITSVGHRVKSKRGTQFRIRATGILKEYMRKGFALDDDTPEYSDSANTVGPVLKNNIDARTAHRNKASNKASNKTSNGVLFEGLTGDEKVLLDIIFKAPGATQM